MTILEFWGVFMEMGGRLLLTILAVDIMLLLILEISKYGHLTNRRNRSKVSKRQSRWINETTKRRALFDGMEILETDTKRIPARPDKQGARPVIAKEGIFVTRGDGSRRVDGITIDSIQGDTLTVRRSKDELSETTVSKEPLSSALAEVSVN